MTKERTPKLTRRAVIAMSVAAGSIRVAPAALKLARGKPILRLVVDRATGTMRAIDRVIP